MGTGISNPLSPIITTRVRIIRNIFSFASKRILSEYGSYSLQIRMFRYIHKNHLFASFASKYSHKFAIQIFDLMQNNTCCGEFSFQSEYSLKIFCYWRKFASKYSFRSEYLLNFKRVSH